jgi:hypothetical protein
LTLRKNDAYSAFAAGPVTKVFVFPVKEVEKTIERINNTPANKEKSQFLSHYWWFKKFSNNVQTEMMSNLKKVSFAPGFKIIEEGEKHDSFYLIIRGECHMVCAKT